MDTIILTLDRLRETQFQVQGVLQHHGDLLKEIVLLQKEAVRLHQETVTLQRMSISQAKASSPADSSKPPSPELSLKTVPAAIQWAVALGIVTWVVKGGDPSVILKTLAAFSGN